MSWPRSCSLFIVFFSAVAVAAEAPTRQAEVFIFHHEHVLGTSLEIQVQAASEEVAAASELRVLNEIERLTKIFSTYDDVSEFSRWQKTTHVATRMSPELFEVLAASQRWTDRSKGVFQPGIEVANRLWAEAQARNTPPTDEELQAASVAAMQTHWNLDPHAKTVTRLTDCPLSLNAIAKGAIVEWACRAGCKSPAVQGLIVNLGGDLRVCGDTVQKVAIADPRHDAENARPLESIFVANRAVATSGDYRRGYAIQGRWHSHILDPRTARSASQVISATIVAPSSQDADALATICNILPAAEGLALVQSLPDVDCLLLTSDGGRHPSTGWDELAAPRLFRLISTQAHVALAETTPSAEQKDQKSADKSDLLELRVDFELDRPKGAIYHRPYVAVWLEDADEFPVKTALLWLTTKQPGPQWHRDLLRWYRNDRVRKLADKTELIGTVSAATRNPGKYKAIFDGKDDADNPLKPGEYTLYIEVAREHGTYQLIRHPITLGAKPIPKTELKSNVEVKSASLEYRRRDAADK